MALPPILSGLPVLKLFGLDKASRAAAKSAAPQPANTPPAADSVELSLPQTPTEAKNVAVQTGQQLADGSHTLGLDPQFAG